MAKKAPKKRSLSKFVFLGVLGAVICISTITAIAYCVNRSDRAETTAQIQKEESPPSFSVEELFNLTNKRRAEAGRNPLSLDPVLNDSAQRKCEDMAAANVWEHGNPRDYLPARDYAGENLALGYQSEEETVDAWMVSPGHRKNIENEFFEHVGFGICIHQNKVSIVQHFSD